MLTIGIAAMCCLAGILAMVISGVAIRHYYRKAWYAFWAGMAVFVISGIYVAVWMSCYGA